MIADQLPATTPAREADELRAAHIAHARLMHRRHRELARGHYERLIRLLRDRERGGEN